MGCSNQLKQNVPTDAQMIEHFNLHKRFFEELCLMIENDSIDHYPSFAQEKRNSKVLPISADRQLEYDSLMRKIQIVSFWYSNPYQITDNKSVLFFYFGKGDATWGIDKGYEYVPERSNEEGKEFTENELYDLSIEKHENCNLYKKINDKWNLFLIYDR
jgi:L-rhamnose mutarotase